MVDPNIRPNFITDEAGFRDRIDRMIKLADIVKVSDEDLNWIMQTTNPLETKAARLQELGPSMVILTRASAGAQAWRDEF